LVRVGEALVAASAALTVSIGLCAWVMQGGEPANALARAQTPRLSVFGTIHPPLLSYGADDGAGANLPHPPPMRVASLDSTFESRFAPAATALAASFEDRFSTDRSNTVRTVTIAPDTTAAIANPAQSAPDVAAPALSPRVAAAVPLPRAAPRSIVAQAAPTRPAPRYRLASLSDTPLPTAYAPTDSPPKDSGITDFLRRLTRDPAGDAAPKDAATKDANPPAGDPAHTAIYDISARTVYLPNGERLEAHSGLGGYMDDVRSVNLKMRGATPPNVYDLRLREASFHGVQAIRLVPVEGSRMYGRDGMLVHPFMLGPEGQSNGCVSLKDYTAFLNAYQRGEITRLVVVEQLDDPPGARTAAGWFSNTLKRIFGPS
jgi:hypothetical protein